jgi:hypothetical protein
VVLVGFFLPIFQEMIIENTILVGHYFETAGK